MREIPGYLWRVVLAVTGVFLLIVIAPHTAPWQMRWVEASLSEGNAIRIALGGREFVLSLAQIALSVALLWFAALLRFPSWRHPLRALLARPRSSLALLLALGGLAFTLNPTPGGWGIVLYLLLGSLGIAALLVAAWPLVARGIDRTAPLGRRILGWGLGVPTRWFLGAVFLWTFLLTNLGSYFLFDHIPHIQDSTGQVFHGRIFLLGRLTAPSHELHEFFDFLHVINNGRWYSEYPPGHSLLMSLGHLLHAPWVINPLFGALAVVFLYLAGRECYGERVARLAALLGCFSPFLIFMASEFMNHTTTLFFVEVFLLGFARMIRRRGWWDALLAGAGLGYAFLIRPLTAVAIGAPFAVYAVILLIQKGRMRGALPAAGEDPDESRRNRLRRLVACYLLALISFSFFVLMFLGFNYRTNGNPFLSGYEVLWGKGHNPGFGHSGWGEPHTPQKGYVQTRNNLNALNKYLFEWPIPSLLFAFLLFASGRTAAWDWLLLASGASLAFAYFFYWFQDWCFGPRFMHESTAAWLLLTARGLLLLPDTIAGLMSASRQRVRGAVTLLVLLCILVGLASNLPTLFDTYSSSYWGANGDVRAAVKREGLRNALVFVRSYYGSVFSANDPLLRGSVIYARDLGERNQELMARFPGRKYYLAEGSRIWPLDAP